MSSTPGSERKAEYITMRLVAARVLTCCTFVTFIACRATTPSRSPWKPEMWILPNGYVGWLRLDYSVDGAPALPVENGRYLVRMPPTGRMQTSTANSASIGTMAFASEDPKGRHGLRWSSTKLFREYAVQHAYSVSRGQGAQWPVPDHECVFVGTSADFKASHRNCDAWERGQPAPPLFRKYIAPPKFGAGQETKPDR